MYVQAIIFLYFGLADIGMKYKKEFKKQKQTIMAFQRVARCGGHNRLLIYQML